MAAEPSYPGSQSGIIHCCPAQDSWRLQQQKLGQHTGPFHHWQIRTRLNYHCSQFAGTRSPSPANSDVNIFRPAVNQSVAAAPLHLQGWERPGQLTETTPHPDHQSGPRLPASELPALTGTDQFVQASSQSRLSGTSSGGSSESESTQ